MKRQYYKPLLFFLVAATAHVPIALLIYYVSMRLLAADASGISGLALVLGVAGIVQAVSFIAVAVTYGHLLRLVGVAEGHWVTIPAACVLVICSGVDVGAALPVAMRVVILSILSVVVYGLVVALLRRARPKYVFVIIMVVLLGAGLFAVNRWNARVISDQSSVVQ